MIRSQRKLAGAVAVAVLLAPAAFAQDVTPEDAGAIAQGPAVEASAQNSEWSYSASVYGWFSGLDASVGTEFGTVETDLSFSDVWDMLDMAFFGTFEARKGQLGFIVDLNYTDLSTTNPTPAGAAFSSATIDTTLTILSGYATWRVSDTAAAKVDLAGGFRAYDLQLDVALAAGAQPAQSFSEGDRWIDPLVGARVIVPFAENWYATGVADIGGFGIGDASELSYQALVTVGYRFNDTWSVQGGYRYIGIDKTLNGRDVTLDLSGPLLGVTARF
jgi:opacity protein-like surface antigen